MYVIFSICYKGICMVIQAKTDKMFLEFALPLVKKQEPQVNLKCSIDNNFSYHRCCLAHSWRTQWCQTFSDALQHHLVS